MSTHQIENYRTRNLPEAAMLIVNGQQLLTIERDGSICWFIFSNKEICDQLSNKYYFAEVLVNARVFYEACSRLKGRVFARE